MLGLSRSLTLGAAATGAAARSFDLLYYRTFGGRCWPPHSLVRLWVQVQPAFRLVFDLFARPEHGVILAPDPQLGQIMVMRAAQ